MKHIISICLLLAFGFTTFQCFAGVDQERMYLVQILNQLNAIQPLILKAQKEQPANTRIQFHYSQYKDTHGQLHNGLLEDAQAIKKGIEQALNHTSIEPRTVAPIKGDYINLNKGASHAAG